MANSKEYFLNGGWKNITGPGGNTVGRIDDFDIFSKGNTTNNSAVLSDRQWAENQAQKQIDFQKMMSDTSWQRGVEDLQKAGLNPALAYMQGGASSAVGSQAQTSSTDQKAVLQRERMLFGLVNSALGILKAIV